MLQRAKQLDNNLPVIVITSHGEISGAIKAIKASAFDYMEKPGLDGTHGHVIVGSPYSVDIRMSNKHRLGIIIGLSSVPLGRFPLKQLDFGILRKHLLQSLPALWLEYRPGALVKRLSSLGRAS